MSQVQYSQTEETFISEAASFRQAQGSSRTGSNYSKQNMKMDPESFPLSIVHEFDVSPTTILAIDYLLQLLVV